MGMGKVQQAVRGLLDAGVPFVWLGGLRWESFGPPKWSTTRRENVVKVQDREIAQTALAEPLRLLLDRPKEAGHTPDPRDLILPKHPLIPDTPMPVDWLQVLAGTKEVEDDYLTRAMHLGWWLYVGGHAARGEAERWGYYYLDHLTQTQDTKPFYTVGSPAAEAFMQGATLPPTPTPDVLDDLQGVYESAPVTVQRTAPWDRVVISWRALWGSGIPAKAFWPTYNAWWGTSAEPLLGEAYHLLGLPLPSTPRGRVGAVDPEDVARVINLAQFRAEREIEALVQEESTRPPEPAPHLADEDLDTPAPPPQRKRKPRPVSVPSVVASEAIEQNSPDVDLFGADGAASTPTPSLPVPVVGKAMAVQAQRRREGAKARGAELAKALAEFGEGFGKLAEAVLKVPQASVPQQVATLPPEILGHVLRVWGVFRLSDAVLARHGRVRKPLGRSLPVNERRAQARGRLDAQWKPNVPYYTITLGNTRPLILTEEQWKSLEAIRAWSAGRSKDEAERNAYPLLPRILGSPELGVWSLVELQQAARNYHRALPPERRVPDYDDGLDLPPLPSSDTPETTP